MPFQYRTLPRKCVGPYPEPMLCQYRTLRRKCVGPYPEPTLGAHRLPQYCLVSPCSLVPP
eukprot:1112726-Rhodomonas_salina.1